MGNDRVASLLLGDLTQLGLPPGTAPASPPTRWHGRSGPRISDIRLTVPDERPHSPRHRGSASALGSGTPASPASESPGGRRRGASKANSYHLTITPMRPGLPQACVGPNGGSGKDTWQESTHG